MFPNCNHLARPVPTPAMPQCRNGGTRHFHSASFNFHAIIQNRTRDNFLEWSFGTGTCFPIRCSIWSTPFHTWAWSSLTWHVHIDYHQQATFEITRDVLPVRSCPHCLTHRFAWFVFFIALERFASGRFGVLLIEFDARHWGFQDRFLIVRQRHGPTLALEHTKCSWAKPALKSIGLMTSPCFTLRSMLNLSLPWTEPVCPL